MLYIHNEIHGKRHGGNKPRVFNAAGGDFSLWRERMNLL